MLRTDAAPLGPPTTSSPLTAPPYQHNGRRGLQERTIRRAVAVAPDRRASDGLSHARGVRWVWVHRLQRTGMHRQACVRGQLTPLSEKVTPGPQTAIPQLPRVPACQQFQCLHVELVQPLAHPRPASPVQSTSSEPPRTINTYGIHTYLPGSDTAAGVQQASGTPHLHATITAAIAGGVNDIRSTTTAAAAAARAMDGAPAGPFPAAVARTLLPTPPLRAARILRGGRAPTAPRWPPARLGSQSF